MVLQVVKREASESDISFNDSMPAIGTKRSVRDRLGSSSGDGYFVNGTQYNGNSKRCVHLFNMCSCWSLE